VDAGGSALLKNLSIHGLMAGKLKYLAHEWLSFEPRTEEREAIRQRKSTHICASYLWICEYLNNSELALFGDFFTFFGQNPHIKRWQCKKRSCAIYQSGFQWFWVVCLPVCL